MGIIILLIGVFVNPAFAVNTKLSNVYQQNEEDCNCGKVSKTDFIRVERLLNRLEVYLKILFILSRNNLEIKEKSEKLLDILNAFNIWNFTIIWTPSGKHPYIVS